MSSKLGNNKKTPFTKSFKISEKLKTIYPRRGKVKNEWIIYLQIIIDYSIFLLLVNYFPLIDIWFFQHRFEFFLVVGTELYENNFFLGFLDFVVVKSIGLCVVDSFDLRSCSWFEKSGYDLFEFSAVVFIKKNIHFGVVYFLKELKILPQLISDGFDVFSACWIVNCCATIFLICNAVEYSWHAVEVVVVLSAIFVVSW